MGSSGFLHFGARASFQGWSALQSLERLADEADQAGDQLVDVTGS